MELTIKHSIFKEHNLFACKAAGPLTFERLYQHVIELMTDMYFQSGLNGIYDFTQVSSMTGDINSWNSLAIGMKDVEILPVPANTSIVIDSRNNELKAVLENYLEMTKGSNIHYKLFTEIEWAQAMQHVHLDAFDNADLFFEQIHQ
jgi:hypothetical protein